MVKRYIFNLLVSLDQLGNAITGGEPDSTISARIGFFSLTKSKYWGFMRSIVDFTFDPVDGPDHCLDAYKKDSDEKFKRGNDIALFFLSLLTILICIPIALILRLLSFLFLI